MVTSGLEAAILDFTLPDISSSIANGSIGMADHEIVRSAVGISFLSRLQAEI